MIKLNIHEAKTHLSRYLKHLARGERILLCKRNVPIAEIRPLRPALDRPRSIGLQRGELELPASFFEPLAEELLAAFEGRGGE